MTTPKPESDNDSPRSAKRSKPVSDSPSSGVPAATVTRLALYLRELQHLQRMGHERIQSGTLASHLGLNDSQVRRDLSCFGQFGRRGVGYSIARLMEAIQSILGTDRSWNVILVGIGNLGRALSGYRGFHEHGFQLVGAFDADASKIGTKIGDLVVQPLEAIEGVVAEHAVELAILAVPAASAKAVVQRLEISGVTGILNFAPTAVKKPGSKLTVVDVDLAVELQRLAFAVVNQNDDLDDE